MKRALFATMLILVATSCAHRNAAIEAARQSRNEVAQALSEQAAKFGVQGPSRSAVVYSDGKNILASLPLASVGNIGPAELAQGADIAIEYLDASFHPGLRPDFYRIRVTGSGSQGVADIFNARGRKVASRPATISAPIPCPVSYNTLVPMFPEERGAPDLTIHRRESCWLIPREKRVNCLGPQCCLCASF